MDITRFLTVINALKRFSTAFYWLHHHSFSPSDPPIRFPPPPHYNHSTNRHAVRRSNGHQKSQTHFLQASSSGCNIIAITFSSVPYTPLQL